jgi:hypothetical protein
MAAPPCVPGPVPPPGRRPETRPPPPPRRRKRPRPEKAAQSLRPRHARSRRTPGSRRRRGGAGARVRDGARAGRPAQRLAIGRPEHELVDGRSGKQHEQHDDRDQRPPPHTGRLATRSERPCEGRRWTYAWASATRASRSRPMPVIIRRSLPLGTSRWVQSTCPPSAASKLEPPNVVNALKQNPR